MSIEKIINEMRQLHSELLMVGKSSSYNAFADELEVMTKEPVGSVYRDDYGNICVEFHEGFYVKNGASIFAAPPSPELEADDDADFNALLETAYVDPGANPPVSYKDKVEELEMRAAAMREWIEETRDRILMPFASGHGLPMPSDAEGLGQQSVAVLSADAGREYAERLRDAETKAQTFEDAAVQTEAADAYIELLKERLWKAEESRDLFDREAVEQGVEIDQLQSELEQYKEQLRKAVEKWDAWMCRAHGHQIERNRLHAELEEYKALAHQAGVDCERAFAREDQLRAELEECKGKVERAAEGVSHAKP